MQSNQLGMYVKGMKVVCIRSIPDTMHTIVNKITMPKKKMVLTVCRVRVVNNEIYLGFDEITGYNSDEGYKPNFPEGCFIAYDMLSEAEKKDYDLFFFHVN